MKSIHTITATELLKKRGELLRRCYVDKQHFVIENHGLPIAALIPFDEYRQAFDATSEANDS